MVDRRSQFFRMGLILVILIIPCTTGFENSTFTSDNFDKVLNLETQWSVQYYNPETIGMIDWATHNGKLTPVVGEEGKEYNSDIYTSIVQEVENSSYGSFYTSVEMYKDTVGQTELRLWLIDEEGDRIACGGIWDGWITDLYKYYAVVYENDQTEHSFIKDENVQDFHETVIIQRDAENLISVYYGDNLLVSSHNSKGLKKIQLQFRAARPLRDSLYGIEPGENWWFDNFVIEVDGITNNNTSTGLEKTLFNQSSNENGVTSSISPPILDVPLSTFMVYFSISILVLIKRFGSKKWNSISEIHIKH